MEFKPCRYCEKEPQVEEKIDRIFGDKFYSNGELVERTPDIYEYRCSIICQKCKSKFTQCVSIGSCKEGRLDMDAAARCYKEMRAAWNACQSGGAKR